MRALTGLLVLAAFAALPPSANAQEPMCNLGGGDMAARIAFQNQLGPYMAKVTATAGQTTGGEADEAARAVLGSQLAMLWLDFARQGWTVAYSPGSHDATSARAAVRSYLATRLDPAAVDFLDRTLTLLPTPYSKAELDALAPQMLALLQNGHHLFSSVGTGCQWSDGVRIQLGVVDPETPELRAQVEPLVAPFGDKVVVRYGQGRAYPAIGIVTPPGQPPAQDRMQQRPTPKVREFIALPLTSRCARTVGARPKAGLDVKRVRLQIGKRVSAGKHPRLRLKSRRSTVKVTVTLTDGTRVFEDLTYRRCS